MVRYANKEDLLVLIGLREQSEGMTRLQTEGNAPLAGTSHEVLLDFLMREDTFIAVAEKDGKIEAYALAEFCTEPATKYRPAREVCYIPELRTMSYSSLFRDGNALLDFIKAKAYEKGFKRLELDVADANEGRIFEMAGLKEFRSSLGCEISPEDVAKLPIREKNVRCYRDFRYNSAYSPCYAVKIGRMYLDEDFFIYAVDYELPDHSEVFGQISEEEYDELLHSHEDDRFYQNYAKRNRLPGEFTYHDVIQKWIYRD